MDVHIQKHYQIMYKIEIKDNCVKCGRCAEVCPASILEQDPETGIISVNRPWRCIACGQCAAACPTGALSHEAFPSSKIVPFSIKDCPTPNPVSLLLKKRRSNRTFTDAPVDDSTLERIIEAANYAPTAQNSRDVSYTVLSSDQAIKRLCDFTVTTFDNMVKRLENPFLKPFIKLIKPQAYKRVKLMSHVVRTFRGGDDCLLRNAPVVILFHTKANACSAVPMPTWPTRTPLSWPRPWASANCIWAMSARPSNCALGSWKGSSTYKVPYKRPWP